MFSLILIFLAAAGAAAFFFSRRTTVDGAPLIRLPGKKLVIAVLVILLAGGIVFGSVYQLQEDEYAVITTFGKPSVVSSSGLKFKIPLIQKKTIVSKATQGFAIGYNLSNNASFRDLALVLGTGCLVKAVTIPFAAYTVGNFLIKAICCVLIPNGLWILLFRKTEPYRYLREKAAGVTAKVLRRN